MRRFFLTSLLIVVAVTVSAVPAKRGLWRTIILDDGTQVRAELRGDEFCQYWQASDGTCYTEQADTRLFMVADKSVLTAKGEQRRQKANAQRMRRAPGINKSTGRAYTGTKKGLIILVEFTDSVFAEDDVQELYTNIANTEGFTNDMGFKGSVHDYFYDQSNGQFDFQFDVVGPVKMNNRSRYYGADGTYYLDTRISTMVVKACEGVDDDVNFADYDWDDDGEVDLVAVIYAGQGQNTTGNSESIYPQEGSLSALGSSETSIELDGVTIDTFACSSEKGVNSTIDGIGTICHEFSHVLGLPDMYDAVGTYDNFGMSIWDVMDMGNYLDDSFTPVAYTSYERMFCGWQEPIILSNDTVVSDMKPLADGGDTYIIYNDNHTDEFYMLENRQAVGWDAGLSVYGNGLLILHVDYDESTWTSNRVNSYSTQHCTIFHADDTDGSDYIYDVAGDPYPYGDNNSLTTTSTPQGTLYNENTDGSLLMNKDIYDITQNDDGTISFAFRNNFTTGITTVSTTTDASSDSRIYSVDGRYVGIDGSSLGKGVYVIGGKKIIK